MPSPPPFTFHIPLITISPHIHPTIFTFLGCRASEDIASSLHSNPRADSQVLASRSLARLDLDPVSASGRGELRAGQVEETDYISVRTSIAYQRVQYQFLVLTGPAKVVGIKECADEWPNIQVLASGQSDSLRLDENSVFGVWRRATAAVIVEAGVDAGDAAVLAFVGILLNGGGADGQDSGNKTSESSELHSDVVNWRLAS